MIYSPFFLSIYGCAIQTKLYHNIWRQRTKYNSLSVKQQLFQKGWANWSSLFVILTLGGRYATIDMPVFSISIVIVHMSFGKRDHPYNKETALHENSTKLPVQSLTWNSNTGVLKVLKISSKCPKIFNGLRNFFIENYGLLKLKLFIGNRIRTIYVWNFL